jgi:hypothetical protein
VALTLGLDDDDSFFDDIDLSDDGGALNVNFTDVVEVAFTRSQVHFTLCGQILAFVFEGIDLRKQLVTLGMDFVDGTQMHLATVQMAFALLCQGLALILQLLDLTQ